MDLCVCGEGGVWAEIGFWECACYCKRLIVLLGSEGFEY